jgi:hypothetical protein
MTLRNAFEEIATEDTAIEQTSLLRRIVALLMSPRGYDKTSARQRVTASIENLPTLASVTTVTTVTTVGNIGQIAGRDASMWINPINRTSWALTCRARIS